MSDQRPPHFPPGTPLGDHFMVEGLARFAEGRMFYLANDHRPDQPTRKCWSCGATGTLRAEAHCEQCQAPLRDRRFLISSRWRKDSFEAYEKFFLLGLRHPALAAPIEVFREYDQLLSVIPYENEGLLLDESAPLANSRVLDIAQRLTGMIAFLRHQGVVVQNVTRANVLVSPDNRVRLFDVDVTSVESTPVRGEAAEIASLAQLLRRYCDVESDQLMNWLSSVEQGVDNTVMAFGRYIEQQTPLYSDITYRPFIGANSDVGMIRQLNEDNWGWKKLSPNVHLFVVADGMGGHESGEVASELAVQAICQTITERMTKDWSDLDAIEHLLDQSFQAANRAVKSEGESRGNDMGTTMVSALLLEDRLLFLANVGDSRAYLLRNHTLHQLSRDHSLVAQMVERGRITPEEARNHPHSNILLRTVGTEWEIDIDLFRFELESGDRLLLCSDGLWGEIDDQVMEVILDRYADPRIAARELVRAAKQGGGKDNITLILVQIP